MYAPAYQSIAESKKPRRLPLTTTLSIRNTDPERQITIVSVKYFGRLRAALTRPGRTMILLQDSMQESLPKEVAAFQPVLKRHGYVLLANQPMVTVPEPSQQPAASKPIGH